MLRLLGEWLVCTSALKLFCAKKDMKLFVKFCEIVLCISVHSVSRFSNNTALTDGFFHVEQNLFNCRV